MLRSRERIFSGAGEKAARRGLLPALLRSRPQLKLQRFRIAQVLALAALGGAAGALPHLFFASDVGEPAFFEGAWDESFYFLMMSGNGAAWNEYPLRSLEGLLVAAAGGPNFVSAMLSDILWPMLVVTAAGALALALTRAWLPVIPLTFMLVFACDLLPLNSSAVYPWAATLSHALSTLPVEIRRFVPDAFTPFLYLYRTPEPQLSLAFFFCYLAILVRFLGRVQPTTSDYARIAGASLLCTIIYVFFAAASFMAAGMAIAALLIAQRWRAAGVLIGILTGCAVLFIWLVVQTLSAEAGFGLFRSRLPMIAPSMLYGILLAVPLGWRFRQEAARNPELGFGLLCLLCPIATLNQQVITGLMLQTVTWERYVNYTFVVLGLSLLVPHLQLRWLGDGIAAVRRSCASFGLRRFQHTFPSARMAFAPAAGISGLFLILAGCFLYSAQLATYRQFAAYNLRTLAYAKALDSLTPAQASAFRHVTLDDSSLDAQVRVRTRALSDRSFRGYTDLVLGMKAGAPGASGELSTTSAAVHRGWGFEHAARLGFSPEAYASELLSEIDHRSCWPHLMFQVPFLECAPYQSDFRLYSPERLRAKVPGIEREYAAYRQSGSPALESIVLSTTPLPGEQAAAPWQQELLRSVTLATKPDGYAPGLRVEMRVYLQRPAASKATAQGIEAR